MSTTIADVSKNMMKLFSALKSKIYSRKFQLKSKPLRRMKTSLYAGILYWAVAHLAYEVSAHFKRTAAAIIFGILVRVI